MRRSDNKSLTFYVHCLGPPHRSTKKVDSDQRENQPKGYTSHEVTAPRGVGPSGRTAPSAISIRVSLSIESNSNLQEFFLRERVIRSRPKPWQEVAAESRSWTRVFRHFEWYTSWVAWALGNWAFLDVLDHLGTFSVLIAVIFYFSESGDRKKQRHYQAWQVINTAQGKGGSGGRIEALQELNADHVSLIGVDAGTAFLQGIHLSDANLSRCDLHASDLRGSNFTNSLFTFCIMNDANLRGATLSGAKMENVNLNGADLNGASMQNVTLSGANLDEVDLRGADLENVHWAGIGSIRLANLAGVKNAPPEFLKFASEHGAVSLESDDQWAKLMQ